MAVEAREVYRTNPASPKETAQKYKAPVIVVPVAAQVVRYIPPATLPDTVNLNAAKDATKIQR